jgi:predicted Zn-dependent peptidase
MKKLSSIFLIGLMLFAATMEAQVDRKKMPKPGPAPKVVIGKPQTFTLPNGLKVMVVEDNKLPSVTINLSLDNDPYAYGEKKGVADLTGALLGKGSTKTPKDKFEEEVDFMGATIEISTGGAYASGLSRYFDRILEMMAEAALMPNFTQEELDKERDKAIEGLKSQEKSAAAIAGRVSSVLAYGKNHPFGEYDTEEAMRGITLEDVRNHYSTFFVPGKAYMIVIGDVKFNDVKEKITKHFELWKKATPPSISYSDPQNVPFTQINFVDVPNAVQAEVAYINTVRLKMTDPDYFPVLIANEIVGGSFESYLNKTLREEKAWTYGARSSLPASKNITRFRAGASLKQATVDSAVVEILNQINKIRNQFVSDEDLKNAKATFSGDFIRESAKPRTISSYALRIETQGLPANFYETYLANINKVTKEDIMRVAKKYFLTENARIVVAAKGSEVMDKLEATKIPVFYFDKYGNKIDKPVAQKVEANVTAKAVLEKYLQAIGGIDKVKSVKTLMNVGSAKVPGAPADLMITMKYAEGKFMQDINMMGMSMNKQVVTPTFGYMMQQGQRINLEGDDLKEAQETAQPFAELAMLNKDLKVSAEKFNEVDAYAIVDGKTTHFYDRNTGLKLGTSVAVEQAGQKMEIVTAYKDFKEVKGVKVPFNMVQNVGFELDIKFSEVKINEGVSDADFN